MTFASMYRVIANELCWVGIKANAKNMKHEIFQVENIKCDGCMTTIRKDLLKQTGILTVHVDAENQSVEVTGDDTMDRIHLISRLEHLGYPLVGNNDLLLKAKSYVSCAVGRFDKLKND